MRSEQQLRSFLKVLEYFPADKPLAKFLPEFFRRNKQMGSNDRKSASRLLYNYFRLGRALPDLSIEERLFHAEFLCTQVDNPFLAHFRPDLNDLIGLSKEEKVKHLEDTIGFQLEQVFPFSEHLSSEINKPDFLISHFTQPDLFIRVNDDSREKVKEVLKNAAIPMEVIQENTLALPNGTKLELLFPELDYPVKPYVIQDRSSQSTGDLFMPGRYEHWWDACAASGGKSLLLHSIEPLIKLVVSDIRESVLNNLDERFIASGLRTYQKKHLDLTQDVQMHMNSYQFDGIILDAPCTGSGTWGRSPEMISQFQPEKIAFFQNLQKSIASNVIKYLKPGKPLIYITCSAFKEENEEVVAYLCREFGLENGQSGIISGYKHKADTMYAARLVKPESV